MLKVNLPSFEKYYKVQKRMAKWYPIQRFPGVPGVDFAIYTVTND